MITSYQKNYPQELSILVSCQKNSKTKLILSRIVFFLSKEILLELEQQKSILPKQSDGKTEKRDV